MAKKMGDLAQLLMAELQDLLDAERQLVRALPKMAKAATDEELESALRDHLEVTRGQVQRLEQVFESMDARPRSRPCKGMKGLVEEGQEIIQGDMETALLDSALTGAARKVEHYEMIGYESARNLAQQCGLRDAAELLLQTMAEEMQADRQLAQISKRLIKANPGSQRQTGRQPTSGNRNKRATARPSGRHGAIVLTDHDQIRHWAEEREGHPAIVRGTDMIQIDFPGYSGEKTLQSISWDEWFRRFDERGLALLVQETTASGQKSHFNKLINREEARPQARAAR
jgi:ferritin-like metal-binding protein YciE